MKIDYWSILEKFNQQKILVIGDFILDAYLEGSCTRLAPEASVPVVDVVSKKNYLGGAANAAANLSALGCEVLFCSVTGNDPARAEAEPLLSKAGITTRFIIADPERTTILKTRVSSMSGTLVRFDQGTEEPLSVQQEQKLIETIKKAYDECDAVLVADYDKGILTAGIIEALVKLSSRKPKFIALDSKRTNVFAGIKPALIKPNYEEAIKLLGLSYQLEGRAEQLKAAGPKLLKMTNASLIALTLDKDGAIFFKDGHPIYQCEAPKVVNPNVSGAGDTFISTYLLALIAGASIPVAAYMASSAAGAVVQKSNTAVCSQEELAGLLLKKEKRIPTTQVLEKRCEAYRKEGKRIVFANGCFDILHSGHVSYLRKAKELGEVLIVGLNTDASVKRLKGMSRPINTLEERIEVLNALEFVDHIISFGAEGNDTPVELIKVVRPDFFVKGEDYKNRFLPEQQVLKQIGCKVVFVPYIYKQSTSKIIQKAGAFYQYTTTALSN